MDRFFVAKTGETLRLLPDEPEDPAKAYSALKAYADTLLAAYDAIDTAFKALPGEVASLAAPSVTEVASRLRIAVETALVAGYRAGLVDFFEDTPS